MKHVDREVYMKIGRHPLKPFAGLRTNETDTRSRSDSVSGEEQTKQKKVRYIANRSFGKPLDSNYSRDKI